MLCLFLSPIAASAETWTNFHTDKWSYKSSRVGKKLKFRSSYAYDADSVKVAPSGDVRVWIRETAGNDRLYVGKGASDDEVLYKRLYLWCSLKRYEIVTDEDSEGGELQEMSDAIVSGSVYDSLYQRLCKVKR